MNQIQAMRVFMRVVDLDSFTLAAKQLGLSTASVTRSISTLEAHLNLRLLNRSTRSLSLTEAGQQYLEGCRMVIDKLEEVESNLLETTRDPNGILRIATPMTFASGGLGSLLAAYKTLHPRVAFDVTTFDMPIDMAEGGFDVCFSDDLRHAGSTMVSRGLTSIKEILVASPAYLARHTTPRDPSALAQHNILSVSDGSSCMWQFSDTNGAYKVRMNSTLRSTSSAMVRVAALNHMGIAFLPAPLVEEDIADRTLVPLLSQFEINGGPRQIVILYPGRNQLASKVRSFIDFAVSQYTTTYQPVPLRAVA
jgi:DNA-binding transcriptional LysR family regulator